MAPRSSRQAVELIPLRLVAIGSMRPYPRERLSLDPALESPTQPVDPARSTKAGLELVPCPEGPWFNAAQSYLCTV